jgi:hypothetical protein
MGNRLHSILGEALWASNTGQFDHKLLWAGQQEGHQILNPEDASLEDLTCFANEDESEGLQ